MGHQDGARGQQDGSADDGAGTGEQRPGRTVVATLAEDPQPPSGGVVVQWLAKELR